MFPPNDIGTVPHKVISILSLPMLSTACIHKQEDGQKWCKTSKERNSDPKSEKKSKFVVNQKSKLYDISFGWRLGQNFPTFTNSV